MGAFLFGRQDFPDYLDNANPLGFVCEQVLGFDRADDRDPDGSTYMAQFVQLCADKGYSVRVFNMAASDWSDAPRDRPCLLYCIARLAPHPSESETS